MSDGRPTGPTLAFALPEPERWALEVTGVEEVTASVRRIGFAVEPEPGDREGAAILAPAPGQDLAFTIPDGSGGTVTRRYSLSDADPASATVAIEAVAHGDGPGARWIAALGAGSKASAFGPRGKITVVEGVSTHLFVGDEASFPAIASMVRALSAGSEAVVLVDVADDTERRPVVSAPGVAVALRFLERHGAAPETPDRVLDALDTLGLGEEGVHAYVFGEFRVVNAARRRLLERLSPGQVSPKPYWRAGRSNAGHGEPVRDE